MTVSHVLRAGLIATASLGLVTLASAAPPAFDADAERETITLHWSGTQSARRTAPMPTTDDAAPAKRSVAGPLAGLGPVSMATLIPLDNDPDGDLPRGAAWTPDGQRLVVANRDSNNVMIHDATTGAVIATIDVGDGPNSVAVAPDGSRAVVTSVFDDTIAIIDLATNTLEATVAIGGAEPFAVQITADSSRAVVAVINDAITSQFSVIDLDTHAETVIPVGGMGAIGGVFRVETAAFINLFTHFALTDTDLAVMYDRAGDTVYVADVAAGTLAASIPVAEGPDAVDVTPDGTRAVVGCDTADVLEVIDLTTLTIENSFLQPGINDRRVKITSDGQVATFFLDSFVAFVNVNTGTIIDVYDHGSWVKYDLELTSNDAYTMVGSSQGRLLDTATGSFIQTLVGPVIYELDACPADTRMVGLNPLDDEIVTYDANGALGSVLDVVPAGVPVDGDDPYAVDIAPGGDLAVVGLLTSGNAAVVELPSGTIRSYIECGERVKRVAISPDGETAIVLPMDENEVVVIDLATDTVIGTLPISTRPGRVRFSPDSSEAYVLNIAGTDRVSFIELEPTPTIVAQLSAGQTGAANGPTFTELSGIELTADGSILAVCDSFNDMLRLYDTATRTQIASVDTGDFPLHVAFTPDGTRAYVTNHFDDSVTVIEVNGALSAPLTTIAGMERYPLEVKVTPDGAYAYVATRNVNTGFDALYVIDTATNAPVGLADSFAGYPRTMVMGQDGILHVATTDSTVARIDTTGGGTAIFEQIDLASSPKTIAVDETTGRTVVVGPALDVLNFIEGDVVPCSNDVDGSGAVDFGDIVAILAAWGEPGVEDLDGSGVVDFGDLLLVLSNWGSCP